NGVLTEYTFENGETSMLCESMTRDPGGAGLTTQSDYNAERRPTTITHPGGGQTRYVYDSATPDTADKRGAANIAQIIQQADSRGNGGVSNNSFASLVTTFTYHQEDKYYQIHTAKPPHHATAVTYTYGAPQQSLVKVVAPAQEGSDVTEYAYNDFGQITRTLAADGGLSQFHYYRGGNTIPPEIIAESNNTDGAYEGYLYSVERTVGGDFGLNSGLPAGDQLQVWYTGRDAYNRLRAVTQPTGGTSITEYDHLGQLLSQTMPRQFDAGGEAARQKTTYEDYDARGLVGQVTHSNPVAKGVSFSNPSYEMVNTVATYDYDGVGRVTNMTQPIQGDEGETEYKYEAGKDRLEYIQGPTGAYTVYRYDTSNRPQTLLYHQSENNGNVASMSLAGYAQTLTYDASSDVDQIVSHYGGQNGPTDTLTIDRDGFGRAVRTGHNVTGTVTQVQHDSAGRVMRSQGFAAFNELVSSRFMTYHGPSGQLDETTDETTGAQITHQFTPSQNHTRVTGPLPGLIEEHYANAVGFPVAINTHGITTTRVFDLNGNLECSAMGSTTGTAYHTEGGNPRATPLENQQPLMSAPYSLYSQANSVLQLRIPEIQSPSEYWRFAPSAPGTPPGLTRDPRGREQSYDIDEAGDVKRTIERTEGGSEERTTEVVVDRNLVDSSDTVRERSCQIVFRPGQVIETFYDVAGRVSKINRYYAQDPTDLSDFYDFENLNLADVTLVTEEFIYDSLRRLEQHRREDGSVLVYEYYPGNEPDANNRRRLYRVWYQ
ncbi:MAG: hypothetical protein AAGL98_03105, partial [Planctomycetota bacterium]